MYGKTVDGSGLRFHEPKVSFVIEPAGSLMDYLDKPNVKALFLFAVHGAVEIFSFVLI
jgi:hypothetical protein